MIQNGKTRVTSQVQKNCCNILFYGGGHPSGDCLSRGHSRVSVTKTRSIVRCIGFLRRRLPVHCSHCVAEVVNKHLVSSRTWLGMSKEYQVKYLSLLACAELVVFLIHAENVFLRGYICCPSLLRSISHLSSAHTLLKWRYLIWPVLAGYAILQLVS